MNERQTSASERPISEEMAELRRELAAVHARLDRTNRRPRPRGRFARLLPLGIVALMMALVPFVTLAANPFTDLNSGSPHNGNIDLIYNAGITTGCGPTSYCPNGNVTREEMASFLARTAGLGTNPPVVNAKSLGGQPASAYIRRDANDFGVRSTTQIGGALPKSVNFTSNGGRLLIYVSGTAYSSVINDVITVNVALDGTSVGGLTIAANEINTHKALAPIMVSSTVPAGNHSIALSPDPGRPSTKTDIYDVFNVTVVELPIP